MFNHLIVYSFKVQLNSPVFRLFLNNSPNNQQFENLEYSLCQIITFYHISNSRL